MKRWFSSKTILFNLLTILAVSSGWIIGIMTAHPYWVVALVLFNAGINLILRCVTKAPIK